MSTLKAESAPLDVLTVAVNHREATVRPSDNGDLQVAKTATKPQIRSGGEAVRREGEGGPHAGAQGKFSLSAAAACVQSDLKKRS